jgi:hypothetical protein
VVDLSTEDLSAVLRQLAEDMQFAAVVKSFLDGKMKPNESPAAAAARLLLDEDPSTVGNVSTVQRVLARLEREDPKRVVPHGFHRAHSYRGNYCHLGVEPKDGVAIGAMTDCLVGVVGKTLPGWRGGEYRITEWTPIWLANYGEFNGETLGPRLLNYMLGEQ